MDDMLTSPLEAMWMQGKVILHLMALMMMLSKPTSSVKVAQALPNCPNECGNITIPYPFGTKEGCYLSKLFQVDCKNLQIWNTTFKLQEIRLDGHIRGLLPMAHRCYNDQHKVTSKSEPRINLSRFPISSTRNMLTAVGCDARADIKTINAKGYITGCLSMTSCKQLTNGSCFGMGCSQTKLRYRMKTFRIHADSNTGRVGKWGHNNCTYGFIVEKGRYKFNEMDFGTMQNRASPVVLEWWVGNVSCEKAKKTSMDYFCQDNSVCNDVLHGSKKKQVGYRCECAQGYKGNAYLPDSCKGCSCAQTAATSSPPDDDGRSKIQYQGMH
ncbi:wall-associated receptor kinase 2-like protein [Tanacetum coccineum]